LAIVLPKELWALFGLKIPAYRPVYAQVQVGYIPREPTNIDNDNKK